MWFPSCRSVLFFQEISEALSEGGMGPDPLICSFSGTVVPGHVEDLSKGDKKALDRSCFLVFEVGEIVVVDRSC